MVLIDSKDLSIFMPGFPRGWDCLSHRVITATGVFPKLHGILLDIRISFLGEISYQKMSDRPFKMQPKCPQIHILIMMQYLNTTMALPRYVDIVKCKEDSVHLIFPLLS